jgi:hypothetical protein
MIPKPRKSLKLSRKKQSKLYLSLKLLQSLVSLDPLRGLSRLKELLYNERMKELLAIVVGVNIVIWGLVLIMSMQG